MIIVSSKDRISGLEDLSFCEKFKISLNRARLHGKKGITQSEFAQHIGLSESSISKAKTISPRDSEHPKSRAQKEMQKLIDKVLL